MTTNSYRNILIVGATGEALGKSITNEFLKDDRFIVHILTNEKSLQNDAKAKYFSSFESRRAKILLGDLEDTNSLEKVMSGIEVIVCLVTGNDEQVVYNGQLSLIKAAQNANVKRFVTSDYGFELSKIRHGEIPYYDPKKKIQDFLAAQSKIEYTFIATNTLAQFFTYTSGIDVKNRTVKRFGDASMKMSSAFGEDVAKMIPEILLMPESKNARVQLSSFTTTFDEVISTIESITGKSVTVTEESQNEIQRNYESTNGMIQLANFIKLLYIRGDGYFEKPWNETYPQLQKIKTTSLEEILKAQL